MKFQALISTLGLAAASEGIGIDQTCTFSPDECEYNLGCAGPLYDIDHFDNVQYLCVGFDVCTGDQETYSPS